MIAGLRPESGRPDVRRGKAPGPSGGKTHLVVIQPSSFCNIDCRYCYVPDRLNASMMPDALVEEIFTKIFRSDRLADGFQLVWHHGEPLALGMSFYRSAHDTARRVNRSGKRFVHGIQTNGTLIDESWADFLRECEFEICVSIDGPRHVHDANRVTRGGRGSFDATMRGVAALRGKGMRVDALCVVSSASLPHGREIAEFFVDQGFSSVGLIVEEPWGAHPVSSLRAIELAEAVDLFRRFVEDFYDSWYPHRHLLHVREFGEILTAMGRLKQDPNAFSQHEDAMSCTVISFDREGNISTFSPQMITGTPQDRTAFAVANIRDVDSLDDLPGLPVNRRLEKEIDVGIAMCKRECGYFSFCGGGSPATKYQEHGTFASSETLECIYRKKVIVDVVLIKAAEHQVRVSGHLASPL
jgi:uncharacterized protein